TERAIERLDGLQRRRIETARLARDALARLPEDHATREPGAGRAIHETGTPAGLVPGRPRGEGFVGARQQDLARHDLVHQTTAQRALGIEHASGEDQIERAGETDQARQALRATEAGNDPELDLGQPEARLRIVRRHAVTECERELEAAA